MHRQPRYTAQASVASLLGLPEKPLKCLIGVIIRSSALQRDDAHQLRASGAQR
ncbi:hypothetical protein ZHAS_00009024 [Anopheles sinensis]|uniref:Uncharacterized protein n=1 Tax=Anopheles sinensis TaxID=74873 RepID=A0A084VTX5_ANOSI|nr:hypothetical protein ZHAS_00009024 [Anopheles sinensis]